MSHRTIYIDDCPDHRHIVGRVVRDLDDWEMTASASDAEAVVAIDENSADVVLIDMMMPVISGLDVARIAIARGYSVAFVTSCVDAARELLASSDLPPIPIIDKREVRAALPRLAAVLDAQPWRRDEHEPR